MPADENTAPAVQGLSARTVLEALEKHYRKPGSARDGEILIREVQAPGSARRADLVRIGMWASRGTGVDVHEVKVSRADWLRELDDPAKAEAWWPYCNRFWLVTVPGVVAAGELPEGWGLLELPASGRRFKARAQPAVRKDVRLTVPLLVELLRRADNQRLAEMDRMRQEHRNDVDRVADSWRRAKVEAQLPPDVKGRLDLLKDIESALGVPLDEFGGWPKIPVSKVKPEELAAFLADAKDHVTAQRRLAELERPPPQARHGRRADGASRRPRCAAVGPPGPPGPVPSVPRRRAARVDVQPVRHWSGGGPVSAGKRLAARERARWLAALSPAQARRACGLTQGTIAEALGVTGSTVSGWERGRFGPGSDAGAAYLRVIAGLLRHLEVPEEGPPGPDEAREKAVYECHQEFPGGLLLGAGGLVQPVPVTRPRERWPS